MRVASVLFMFGCLLSIAVAQSHEETFHAQTAPSPARAFFVQMSRAERKNSSISVEFESSDSEAVLLGREVERLWNGGQYDEALTQLGDLEARVGHVAIGNSWRKPVPTHETSLWGSDVRIGNRDSLLGLSFDISMGYHLFVVLRHSHGPTFYSVCMSTDYGSTWAETFTWVGSPITSLDGVALIDHFYVAYYSPGENAQQVRLRRFWYKDGSAVEFSTGDMWVAACTLNVGDTAREVSFVSSHSSLLFIATLVSDGSVSVSESHQDGVPWERFSPRITSGASRGLDATYNLGGHGSTVLLLSYLDTTDTLRIYGWGTGTQRLALLCGTGEQTSISAGSDHVLCAYEDASSSPQRIGYAMSNDGGDTWTTGTLSDTVIAAEAPATFAEYGSSECAAVFRQDDSTPELDLCQRTISGPWSDPVSIAMYEPYRCRPCIKYIGAYMGGETYAIVYLSDTSPVVRGAYYDYGWIGGIAEQQRPQASSRASLATVVRGALFVPPASGVGHHASSVLLDISGRKVLDLRPGANDVSRLAPGVYLVREPFVVCGKTSAIRKVVITR